MEKIIERWGEILRKAGKHTCSKERFEYQKEKSGITGSYAREARG